MISKLERIVFKMHDILREGNLERKKQNEQYNKLDIVD